MNNTVRYIPVAISIKEAEQFGCPYCGFRSSFSPVASLGTELRICGECDGDYAILTDGTTQSAIGFRGGYYPKLSIHPRRGIPCHGRPDIRPEQGGEYFHSRGIGIDTTPGCFVCGGSTELRINLSAHVQCKEAGERIVEMFGYGAAYTYPMLEPDNGQVKVGVCKQHRLNLELLDELTSERGVITVTMIHRARIS